jgi:putative DNA primase/helicase
MPDTLSDSTGGDGPGHVQQILASLGGKPVLLPIPLGTKGPRYKGWQTLTWEATQDPEFRLRVPETAKPGEALAEDSREVWRERRYADLLEVGNIGVLQGEASVLEEEGRTWHLVSIDIDDTAAVEGFVALNPNLASTLQTAGARGRNFWLWVEGEYPPLHKNVCWIATEDHESQRSPGKKIKQGEPDLDRPWGEWRSTGGQTVIYGLHPSGSRYQRVVKNPPVRVKFAEINWPEGLHLPWAPAPASTALAVPPSPDKAVAERLSKLVADHGEPWTVSKKGVLAINQAFFAAYYGEKHKIFYSPEETRFYRYEGEKSGLWSEQTSDNIRWEFAGDIKKISDDEAEPKLINLRTTQLLNALVAMLRGSVEKWKAFERQVSPKTNRPRAVVHLKNGMLDLDEFPPVLRPFGPDYMSRNQLAVAIDEKAECPRFLNDLLGKAVAPDDIVLMQKFAGQMLLGVNLCQKLLILTGTAGGGKSTLVNILSEIIGRVNVGQLRTEHLAERFEIFRLLGKTLLIGVDVPGNFMMSEGAYVIKGLCGGDLMDAEPKNGNHCFQLKGEFNIVITCNTRLKVRLDGDGDAWRRRLAIVNYELPRPAKPDPNYVHRLIAEESAGILNWMIEGAVMLLQELDQTGGMVLTAGQKDRVESLLAESDSVRDFVKRGCVKAPREAKVTSEQLLQAYVAHCEARNWTPVSGKTVAYQLPDALLEIHGATAANDIKLHDGDKAKRGYRGVALRAGPIGELSPEASEMMEPDDAPDAD